MFKPSRNTGYIAGVVQLRNFENCIPFVWPPATLTSIPLKNNVGGYYVLFFSLAECYTTESMDNDFAKNILPCII